LVGVDHSAFSLNRLEWRCVVKMPGRSL
jgi:hypothetical protein